MEQLLLDTLGGNDVKKACRRKRVIILFIMSLVIMTACQEGQPAEAQNIQQVMEKQEPKALESAEMEIEKVPKYLLSAAEDAPFATGILWEREDGTTVSIHTSQERTSFDEMKTEIENLCAEDQEITCIFYKYKLAPDMHGTEIYDYLKINDRQSGSPIEMISGNEGKYYQFIKNYEWDVIVQDGTVYALICTQGVSEQDIADGEEMGYFMFPSEVVFLFEEEFGDRSGWFMDEELLYWVDHEEKESTCENPKRSFLVVRAKDITWPDEIMQNFGLIKQANYELALAEGENAVAITFQFLPEIPEGGYADYLFNGMCMDEAYQMEVRNAENGSILQTDEIKLSIEKKDTITFEDLDGDGWLDMHIMMYAHEMEDFSDYKCYLWDHEKEQFIYVNKKELENARQKVKYGQQEETTSTIIVKKGDTLWKIAEIYYGSGAYYYQIYEKNKDVIGDNPSLILEGMELQLER